MSDNRNLIEAQKAKDNEFYTPIEIVKLELDHWKHKFKDKRIICPCDGPESAFVKYLNEIKEETGIKSVDWSCLPVRYQDVDYSKYDLIITNPPFTNYPEFVGTMKNSGCDYICIGPASLTFSSFLLKKLINYEFYLGFTNARTKGAIDRFFRPDGSTKCVIYWWITSFEDAQLERDKIELKTGAIYNDSYQHYELNGIDYLIINKLKLIPDDYNGWMAVPTTIFKYFNRNQFEYGCCEKLHNDLHLFKRILIKRKKTWKQYKNYC